MPGGGAHPQDAEVFTSRHLPTLRRATSELAFLRERGYALPGALKLVGDRYQLHKRQRLALTRATSEAQGAAARRSRRLHPGLLPRCVWVDGFNVLITLETALRGGVVLRGIDGALRDLSGVHGTYRVSDSTHAALGELATTLRAHGWGSLPLRWLVDRPVSNSGRLAARLREWGAQEGLPWTAEVVPDADPELTRAGPGCAVASSDAVVLDRCPAWVDLPAWSVDLRSVWLLDLEVR